MFDMDKLYKLMESGWNIHMECKGKGRNYEMTFEAVAQQVVTDEMSTKEKVRCMMTQIHATGDNMEDVVNKLESKIKAN